MQDNEVMRYSLLALVAYWMYKRGYLDNFLPASFNGRNNRSNNSWSLMNAQGVQYQAPATVVTQTGSYVPAWGSQNNIVTTPVVNSSSAAQSNAEAIAANPASGASTGNNTIAPVAPIGPLITIGPTVPIELIPPPPNETVEEPNFGDFEGPVRQVLFYRPSPHDESYGPNPYVTYL